MVVLAVAAGVTDAVGVMAAEPPPQSAEARREAGRLNTLPPVPPPDTVHIDRSGRKETGGGSFYAPRFARRKMADGRPMDPNANIAASKSLPLGSVAKVTNLDNGKTATVRIEDRGPYVNGRVVDLAPKVANELDMKTRGVAPVEVAPVTVPEPDGQRTGSPRRGFDHPPAHGAAGDRNR
jgi:rare lipoprotein A